MITLSGLMLVLAASITAAQTGSDAPISASSIETLRRASDTRQISLMNWNGQKSDIPIRDVMIADCFIFFATKLGREEAIGASFNFSTDSRVAIDPAGMIELSHPIAGSPNLTIGASTDRRNILDALVDISAHCRNGTPLF
jgi:hypothetical protein